MTKVAMHLILWIGDKKSIYIYIKSQRALLQRVNQDCKWPTTNLLESQSVRLFISRKTAIIKSKLADTMSQDYQSL